VEKNKGVDKFIMSAPSLLVDLTQLTDSSELLLKHKSYYNLYKTKRPQGDHIMSLCLGDGLNYKELNGILL
jgi:hypothetical protein